MTLIQTMHDTRHEAKHETRHALSLRFNLPCEIDKAWIVSTCKDYPNL